MLKKYWIYIVPFIGGGLYATGFPMFGDYTFILGPIFAFFFLNWSLEQRSSLKTQLFIGWLFSFGFYSAGYYWIPFLLKEFGGLTPPFNYLLGIGFSLILLPQIYFYILFKRNFKSIIVLSLIYPLLEYFIPQQFPSHLGHTFMALIKFLPLNLAPFFGAPIYSFIICLLALSLLRHIQFKKAPHFHYALVILLLFASFLPISENTSSLSKISKNANSIYVRIVQPNIGNFMKVDSERGGSHSMRSVFESYYQLSTATSLRPLDLTIWPETAYPSLMSNKLLKLDPSSQVPPLIKQIIQKNQSEMLIGGYDFNSNSHSAFGFETDYNTAFYFSKNAELKDVYHKIKLIPFGEGLPFGPFNQFLSKYITNVSFFAKGDKPTLFQMPNGFNFNTAICYEILFPSLIRDILNGKGSDQEQTKEADFIINLTNDSWYGDTFEPYQHLFLTKWRAIEFNIPIIRSTNTGISTVIFPNGTESKRMMINEKNYMDVNLLLTKREKTFYQKFGILSFIILGLVFSFLEKIPLLKGRADE